MEFSTNIEDHDDGVMCILPWIHMHPWPNGKTMLCCDSPWDNNIGDLRENSLEEVWNSERMKQVRAIETEKKLLVEKMDGVNALMAKCKEDQQGSEKRM